MRKKVLSTVQARISILVSIILCPVFPTLAIGDGASFTGEFPSDDVVAVFSGPFTRLDRSDLLVLQGVGGLTFNSPSGGVAMGASRLVLYSFDDFQFCEVWMGRSLILQYSLPKDGPISATTWCFGDFDGDGRYSIATCNVREMRLYTFDEQVYEQYGQPQQELISTPDVWIDQLIACDINDDGIDELVSLEYPHNPDSCCIYHVGIYKIVGDKPAGGSLVEIWHGLDHTGSNYGVVPPDHFISKCRIDGIKGEVPIIMASQSDVSLSTYTGIAITDSGQYEIVRPFPKPPQAQSKKGDTRSLDEKELITETNIGPMGGVIFNDGKTVLHYGPFLKLMAPNSSHIVVDRYSFAMLEDDRWKPVITNDLSIRGLLCEFTMERGRTGWLFIGDGKYSFYDKLPVSY